ncbi:hypothetical protein ZIOFF_062949 [Zingiber officinale]|uniref:Uncharacterized protein n=1 Tax=Zingiber officinale TaxID=94328 RepID=A0A8J5F640_ZINOF|nr:hypothetical protein ZIOFF_062949 [Zingiber officinale]
MDPDLASTPLNPKPKPIKPIKKATTTGSRGDLVKPSVQRPSLRRHRLHLATAGGPPPLHHSRPTSSLTLIPLSLTHTDARRQASHPDAQNTPTKPPYFRLLHPPAGVLPLLSTSSFRVIREESQGSPLRVRKGASSILRPSSSSGYKRRVHPFASGSPVFHIHSSTLQADLSSVAASTGQQLLLIVDFVRKITNFDQMQGAMKTFAVDVTTCLNNVQNVVHELPAQLFIYLKVLENLSAGLDVEMEAKVKASDECYAF